MTRENGLDRAGPAETNRKETISEGVDTHRSGPMKALTDVRIEGSAPETGSGITPGTNFAGIFKGSPRELISLPAESALRIDDDPMTFATRGHRLDFVLEGLPFFREAQVFRGEYPGAGGGSFLTSVSIIHRKLSNRPGHLNALLDART